MLKVLIVDDEAPARSRLRRMLTELPAVHVAGEAASAREALRLVPLKEPDVLLLDISMPGMDGMTLAQVLRDQSSPPAVVFCTAWSDQAVEAFECDAVDYLVKPVRAERLAAALDKARRYVARDQTPGIGPMLRSTVGGKVRLLPLADVIYLAAEDKYTAAVHKNGKFVINQTLRELEQEHGDVLLRVHRGALVAKKCIRALESVSKNRYVLQLAGCETGIQVSRRNLSAVRKLIRELT
ncbi:MAG: LytTR family DNA-binding domain-containing protein [Xanthomonadales bacterium]|nr:LytTR family DNA-binding domain-containing protein [Xanthomonadales bacterium]